MKKLALLLVLSLAVCAPACAGKSDADKAQQFGKTMRSLDKNGNQIIDGDEADALKKAFAANPKGPLARLDMTGDGKLEDAEIAAYNQKAQRQAQKKPAAPANPAKDKK
jgi:hypothetical protein